jgi:hypothetical protein
MQDRGCCINRSCLLSDGRRIVYVISVGRGVPYVGAADVEPIVIFAMTTLRERVVMKLQRK